MSQTGSLPVSVMPGHQPGQPPLPSPLIPQLLPIEPTQPDTLPHFSQLPNRLRHPGPVFDPTQAPADLLFRHSPLSLAHDAIPRYRSNHPMMYLIFCMKWLGRSRSPCDSPGTFTSTASTPFSFSAWKYWSDSDIGVR